MKNLDTQMNEFFETLSAYKANISQAVEQTAHVKNMLTTANTQSQPECVPASVKAQVTKTDSQSTDKLKEKIAYQIYVQQMMLKEQKEVVDRALQLKADNAAFLSHLKNSNTKVKSHLIN